MTRPIAVLVFFLLVAGGASSVAEEGFWTFERPPIQRLAKEYGLKTDPVWFSRVEKATLRLGQRGGAAVAVSADGLILLTRHQIESWVSDLGFVGSSILKEGFLAAHRDREVKLEGLTAEQFHSLRNVTSLIRSRAARPGEDGKTSIRQAIREVVEAESTRTGLVCRVQYRQSEDRYVLYRYRAWDDLRLVFCPETAVANFGGDYDNFNFPRWSFDVALLRLYRGGQPAKNPDFLRLSREAVSEGEALVSAGYPRKTKRREPWPLLAEERREFLPSAEKLLSELRQRLGEFCARHQGHPGAMAQLSEVANSLKAIQGYRAALGSSRIVKKLRCQEQAILDGGGRGAKDLASCISALEATLKSNRESARRRMFSRLESRAAARARSLIYLARALAKDPKARSERYRGGNLEDLMGILAKPVDADQDLEADLSGARAQLAAQELPQGDPFVAACQAAADGKGVEVALHQTKLFDAKFCQDMVKGAPDSIKASKDPLLSLVRKLDPIWRDLWGNQRIRSHARIEHLTEEYHRIVKGAQAPGVGAIDRSWDTDGTPRISIGKAAGYNNGVTIVPVATSLWGLLARQHAMGSRSPFKLPSSWALVRKRLNLDTQMVVASTLEAVDNASGSPVVAGDGELRGIIFDTNFEGLAHIFVHDSERGRALIASSALLLEVLQKTVRADSLVRELSQAR